MREKSEAERLMFAENELASLRKEVKELSTDIKTLVDAWNAANSLVKFVKLLATITAALTAIYVFVTHGFSAKTG